MADNKASFLWAIKQQESGGDYSVKNPGSGALGAYQVMPENVGPWTQQALGKKLTPAQFLADPSAQDRVANVILGGYYDQYGAAGAAAMWYSGQPDPNKTYGSPSVKDYVNQVLSRMTTSSPVGGTTDTIFGIPGTPDLGDAINQGLLSAFKAIMAPTLKWSFWFFESILGVAAIGAGLFLIAQKSGAVRAVEGAVVKTAAPEAKPFVEAGEKTVEQNAQRNRTEQLARETRQRRRESAETQRKTRVELKESEQSFQRSRKIRHARAKRILEPKDYRQYRKENP